MLVELLASVEGPRDFSESVQRQLRNFCPHEESEADEHPLEVQIPFANAVLAEARWAFGALDNAKRHTTKEDTRAEMDSVVRLGKRFSAVLRRLSPDADRQFGVDADPLGVADKVDVLVKQVDVLVKQGELGRIELNSQKRKRRFDEMQNAIGLELAIRVLRVAKEYGLKVTACGQMEFAYASTAVKLMKCIGDDIGLRLAELTWRDFVIRAKKEAPDLDAD